MMKYLTLALSLMLNVGAMTHKADANVVNVPYNETAPGQATALITQPVTVNSGIIDFSEQNNGIKPISNSIATVHGQLSQSINSVEFFKNPSPAVQQFFSEKPNQTYQFVEPLSVSKVAPFDSNITEINVTLTRL